MKLRNKKTGEIFTLDNIVNDKGEKVFCFDNVPDGYELTGIPLIKDEKVRKAVRAWAYLASVGEDKVLYHIVATKKEFEYYGNCLRFGSFDTYIGNIEDKTYYTITELCGEEDNEN